MPVVWEIRGDVLVLRYVGNPTPEERHRALDEVMADPAFRPGLSILFDTRSSIYTVSPEELAKRVEWAVGLTAHGFRPRYAVVSPPGPDGIVKTGIAMVAGRVEIGRFAGMEDALAWLADGIAIAEP